MGGGGKGVDISSAERCCACEPPRGVNERRLISCVSQAGVRGERVTDRTRISSCEPQLVAAGIYFCSVSTNLQDLVLIGLFDLKTPTDTKQQHTRPWEPHPRTKQTCLH